MRAEFRANDFLPTPDIGTGRGRSHKLRTHERPRAADRSWRPPGSADHTGQPSWIPGGTAYANAVQYGHAAPSRVVEPFATLIAGYERVFYVYRPLFGLILVIGLGGVVRIRR